MWEINNSQNLFLEAKKYIPGGVNSPVRAFKAVGGDPVFFKHASGAYLYDEDGNDYVDMINSWGPMILGHRHPEIEKAIIEAVQRATSFGAPSRSEITMARRICEMVPSIEKVRMVNSGTEATMSAIRLARGYTGKDKIIKFEGCYHGHGDSFLIAAGSGAITMGTPDSPGVTQGTAKDTLLATFNDLDSVVQLVHAHEDVAAIIIEPVAGNMGCIVAQADFLKGLRELCDQHHIVLIFDEVMTGFRLSPAGAQQLLNVTPDLTTLGKIIGGGMPVGAYGGKSEIMDFVSPEGPVYQAGTLSGNPVAMAAGHAQLKYLHEHPDVYQKLDVICARIVEGIQAQLDTLSLPFTLNRCGSMYTLFFTDRVARNFEEAKTCDTEQFGCYFREMLSRGVYLAPSQFESLFLSVAMDEAAIHRVLEASEAALKVVQQQFALA